MSALTKTLAVLGVTTVSVIGGAAAGYWSALQVPTPPQVAIVRMDDLVKRVATSGADYQAKADQVASLVRERVDRLAEHGIVVIDGTSVISAPPGAYVEIEDLLNPAPPVSSK